MKTCLGLIEWSKSKVARYRKTTYKAPFFPPTQKAQCHKFIGTSYLERIQERYNFHFHKTEPRKNLK